MLNGVTTTHETPSRPDDALPTHDGLLEMLVNLAHEHGMEVGVTLNVAGACMSGLMVSRETWLNELADSQESGTSAHALLSGLREGLNAEVIKNPPSEDQPFNFIHLKNAKVLDGGGVLPTPNGFFWRGRLSEIAGWAFGNVS